MLRVLGLVLSIGFADALNPSTIGPALYLASGERPRRAVFQFTLGVFLVSLLGGVIVALGPGQAVLALIPHPGPTARYVLETAAGASMLVLGVLLLLKRGRLAQREFPRPRSSRQGAVLGATIAGIELPTAFPYFAVIVAVVGSGLGPGQQVLLLVIYNLCFVSPLLVILGILAVAGDRAAALLERARDFLQAHWPVILAVLALTAGAFVLFLGITGLTGRASGRVGRLSRRLRHIVTH